MQKSIQIDGDEPMLATSNTRFVTQREREDLWSFYKKHQSVYWTAEEIDLAHDYVDFMTLTENEQYFIKHILAFFAASDGIVNENLCHNLAVQVQWPEARYFYNFQAMMENIHAETYTRLIETFVKDVSERHKLLDAIETVPCVQAKADWAIRYMNDDTCSFAERLLAFAVVEGVFFSGSFCAIFWLKKRGKCPGLTFSNELISRDENLHCEFACTLYNKLTISRLPSNKATQIVAEAVTCEEAFVRDALPVSLLGMNADQMITYIRFVADRVLVMLGEEPIYGATNPFDFMHMQSLQGKTNFFEKRVGDYKHAASNGDRSYSTDDNF